MRVFGKQLVKFFILASISAVTAQAAFVHPGILHTQADLDRMRQMVHKGKEPFKSGFDVFRSHRQSQSSYRMRGPFAEIGRDPSVHFDEFDRDANAAYQCAIMWCITGDIAYAYISRSIVNSWCLTLKTVSGRDAILVAGLGPFKMVNAAEILRYTKTGWTEADTVQCERMFKNVIYPTIKDFATFANGNWDGACIKTMMAIGIFCDDRKIFNRAVNYYLEGSGNGAIIHYVINENGQCQESGRDQGHTQLGLGHLAESCEISWNQGIDMYGAANNRLLRGYEYTARYNLGHDVPFTPFIDTTGKYKHTAISSRGRGQFRAVWEIAWNHYHNRMGMDMPYTQQVIEKLRPEGAVFAADNIGFGTLLFARPSATEMPGHTMKVKSPDGKVIVDFVLQDEGFPAYKIQYLGKPIVLESRLGFEPDFTDGFVVVGKTSQSYRGVWINEFGERRNIPDNYNELNVDLKHKSGRLMRITLRAYNEGAALRYTFPDQETKKFNFTGEHTEFRFPKDTWGYEAHGTEGVYQRSKIADIQPWCERPLTVEYASGIYAGLAEAANTAYARMMLSPWADVPGALVSALGGATSNTARANQRHDPSVTLSAGESTPWRLFVVGEKPGDLLERNYLMLNLNPPLALKDTSWIKPGKVMRDTTLTTADSKAIIDFAAKGGLQYTHLDWKWYGTEDFKTGDATKVRVPNLDITEIIEYGRSKDVGLIVYVDRRQIKKQRDILFPLFEQWGIRGIKIGFVDVGPQNETAWITETIQRAAEHHLMLNIHDGYRATGNNRTYPNLMTVEGMRGNEHMPTPEHNCTLPFTRYIAGIGDYTICYYDERLKTTHAHQLAMAVISFSPLQWIFWYDKPDMYRGEPEIEFFRSVPTVWDDTKVINGEIARYATIARRSGEDWFVGTINNSEPRQLKIPLAFLTEGKDYMAYIYSDDDSVKTRTKVRMKMRPVSSSTILDVPLGPAGGQAIRITLTDK